MGTSEADMILQVWRQISKKGGVGEGNFEIGRVLHLKSDIRNELRILAARVL
jgi:hypothetical protein